MALTKNTAPKGSRMLISTDKNRKNIFEIEIIEWSSSGEYIKYKTGTDKAKWSANLVKDGVIIEVLPKLAKYTRTKFF